MIRLTDLDDKTLMLNSDLIQRVQETPDTIVVLITGDAFRVAESAEEIRRKVIEFRRDIGGGGLAAVDAALRQRKGME